MVNIRSDNPKCNNKCKCNNNPVYHFMVTYNLIQVWDGCVLIHCCVLPANQKQAFPMNMSSIVHEHTWTCSMQHAALMFTAMCFLEGKLWSCDTFKKPKPLFQPMSGQWHRKALLLHSHPSKTKTSTAPMGGSEGWCGGQESKSTCFRKESSPNVL